MAIETIVADSDVSFSCLALVKYKSELARKCNLEKPSYCIYEFSKAFGEHQIRWGDGSWENLSKEHFNDVVLLRQFDESSFEDILGF